MPKDKAFKVEENEKIIDIVERILELDNEKQLGQGIKILTPNQMLSRLPISLAQLQAGNNSNKLKNEIIIIIIIIIIIATIKGIHYKKWRQFL